MSEEGNNNGNPPPAGGEGNYQGDGYTPEQPPLYEEESVSAATGPAVASSANKNMILVLIGGILGLFLIYQVFSGGEEEVVAPAPVQTGPSDTGASVAPATELPAPITPVPTMPLPPPPPLVEEDPTPLPPPPPVQPDIDFLGDGPNDDELMARRGSQMLIVSGGGKSEKKEDADKDKEYTSSAERAVATNVGNLDNLVLEGKVIDAVLENSLETTLPGPLRAIVSRDVYAESGYGVLIPKGSRLIGTYNTDIVRGQGRVFIIWDRLIRPDGVDIQINSQAIDGLGHSGVTGRVDDRYFEIFGGAILTSILGITLAGVSDAILSPSDSTTTQSADGATTSTTSSVDTAISTGVSQVGAAATRIVGGLLDARPSISIDQGTPLKVFVGRDLEFPTDVEDKHVRIIQ